MHKRIIALLLIALICISVSGCRQINFRQIINDVFYDETVEETFETESKTDYTAAVKNGIVLSPYYESIDITNCYDTLDTDSERKCYNEIAKHVTNITSKTVDKYYAIEEFKILNCYLTERELIKVVDAFIEDHSEVFWMVDSYYYYVGSDYVSLELRSILTKDQYKTYSKRFNKAVSKILSGLKPNMSEFERELYIHDYLVNNCEYDENVDVENDEFQYNAYGAVVDKLAVCAGYADAFHFLLSCVGINSINVSGYSDNEAHQWNIVNIDDEWYHTDITWDDEVKEYMYDYFNLTTKQIKKSHTINPLYEDCTDAEVLGDENNSPENYNFYVPKCTETYYNYYIQKGSVLEDINRNTMAEDLTETANNKEKYFHIYVDPNYLNFKTTYNQLFGDVYSFQHYIEKANRTSKNTLSTSTYSLKKKEISVITVELEYL